MGRDVERVIMGRVRGKRKRIGMDTFKWVQYGVSVSGGGGLGGGRSGVGKNKVTFFGWARWMSCYSGCFFESLSGNLLHRPLGDIRSRAHFSVAM